MEDTIRDMLMVRETAARYPTDSTDDDEQVSLDLYNGRAPYTMEGHPI